MPDAREPACDLPDLPDALRGPLAGYRWARDLVGEAGAAVYRLDGRGDAPGLYVKQGTGTVADDIAAEAERLRWLAGRVAVPAIVAFARETDAAWLVTEALRGETVWQRLDGDPADGGRVVAAMAALLRRLHAVPVAECPFDGGAAQRLAQARARIDAGLVDEDDFDEARHGWTAEQVWAALTALPLPGDDPVVAHGDASLDNIVLDGDAAACLDVGRLGVADRWQDLAIAWRDLGEFGAAAQARFLAAYGVEVDDARLRFHLLLDELF